MTLEHRAEFANRIRQQVVRMTHRAKSSHVGSSLSMAEILATLYGGVLRVRPEDPSWPERDRFVLSKGHGCAGLYAALAERGFFPGHWLDDFCTDGGRLAGHATHKTAPGIEFSTGALGHGLGVACGTALAAARRKLPFRVYTLISDGECDEGSIWEAALFGAHHRLDNLVLIVDYNQIQSLGRVSDVLSLEPFGDKWRAFGWAVREVDGHDLGALDAALGSAPFEAGRPSCLVAHTVKGKGVSFMEDKLLWHYRAPDGRETAAALRELELSK